jgi:6-phosphofructokinase 1
VTCGGLCPGLNDVIRAIVLNLNYSYGVKKIFGFRYGYAGLVEGGEPPLLLTPESVSRIQEHGGSLLGTSRGPQDSNKMLDTLVKMKIHVLFALGGDGTLRGAKDISDAAKARGLKISVIGIPKTIDNDIAFVQRTFGFDTAGTEARRAIYAAYSEAASAKNGIGLVKLMGRDSGFIASYASLSNGHVDFCLIPEVPFTIEKLLPAIDKVLSRDSHVVIVAAEGAGQDLMQATGAKDASGNVVYGDIGFFLRDKIKAYFKKLGKEVTLKYIDPSYEIRSCPANAQDAVVCLMLGQNAVHAAMSGRTAMVVGYWNQEFTHVPISLVTTHRKKIDPASWFWKGVVAATGQPAQLA